MSSYPEIPINTFTFCDESIITLLSKTENHLESVDVFREYLLNLKKRKLISDQSFVILTEIKEIKKTNIVILTESQQNLLKARENYEPFRKKIETVEHKISGKLKEIDCRLKAPPKKNKKLLSASSCSSSEEGDIVLSEPPNDNEEPLAVRSARNELETLENELNHLKSNCIQYQEYQSASKYDEELKIELGITRLKDDVSKEHKVIGAACAVQGTRLETIMATDLLPHLISAVQEQYGIPTQISESTQISLLSNVGASKQSIKFASCEFDGWLVESVRHPNGLEGQRMVTRVLAIIEAKNNPNDIGQSFVHMQECLAFLTNSHEDFDQKKWKTKQFPKGDFSRPCQPICHLEVDDHSQANVVYEISSTAFEHFKKFDTQNDSLESIIPKDSVWYGRSLYIQNIFYVTRRKWLNGFHSSKVNVFSHKLACDLDLDDDNMDSYAKLWATEVEQTRNSLNTAQVLQLFQQQSQRPNAQVVLVHTSKTPSSPLSSS